LPFGGGRSGMDESRSSALLLGASRIAECLDHRFAGNPHPPSLSLELDGRVPDRRLRPSEKHLHSCVRVSRHKGWGCRWRTPFGNG
jgi:hypothetical protein